MVNKNIQMKKREGNDWDNLFPLTTTENVYSLEGKPLTDSLTEIEEDNLEQYQSIQTLELLSVLLEKDLNTRGVNVLNPPEGYVACVGDGVTDDTLALQQLIDDFDLVVLPNKTYRVTDTIYLNEDSKRLVGVGVPNAMPTATDGSSLNHGATLFYDGVTNRQKSVIIVGKNDVNEAPELDGSGLVLENIVVDGNDKIGFGVYGTYLTNETTVNHVVVLRTLEYGFYFARSWYVRFFNLTARHNMGKGLAFGMPLIYQNGNTINWTTNAPLEMNNTPIKNIRSHTNGKHYSHNNPSTFNIENASMRKQGYGIGLGLGNGFTVDNFTSEASGGVNLYVYTASQPLKTIQGGYLENPMSQSGVSAELKTNMLIEHTDNTGFAYEIRDVFMNYNSGGIHFTGLTGRQVWLRNVHQPRFLKSLEGLSNDELYAVVLKDNVYQSAGTYNTHEFLAVSTHYEMKVNTRYSWNFQVPRLRGGVHKLYVRYSTGTTTNPVSSIKATNLETGAVQSYGYPSLSSGWTLVGLRDGSFNHFSLGGSGGTVDIEVDFKVVSIPTSLM